MIFPPELAQYPGRDVLEDRELEITGYLELSGGSGAWPEQQG